MWTLEHDITSPDFGVKGAAVHIDNWAYIGPRVTILSGVRIGTGAVVAAGACCPRMLSLGFRRGVPAKFTKKGPSFNIRRIQSLISRAFYANTKASPVRSSPKHFSGKSRLL